jgi:hypothetical protein
MTRIAVVGNSHAGAIRMGWDVVAHEYPGTAMTFLAAPRAVFETFGFDGERRFGVTDPAALTPNMRRLVQSLSGAGGGALALELAAFDRVLLVGPEWGEFALMAILSTYAVDGCLAAGAQRLSAAAFAAFCDDLLRRSLALRMAALLAGHRLTLMPRPRRSELGLAAAAAGEEAAMPRLAPGLDPAGVERAIALHEGRLAALLAAHGATLLPQPPETVAENHFSRAEFSVGRKVVDRRGVREEVLDTAHMNAAYGALCLRRWLGGAG